MALLKRSELPVWLVKKYRSATALATALGVTRQTAHNLLTGRTIPSYENCEKLGLSAAFLVRETEGTVEMTTLDDFLMRREQSRLIGSRMSESELSLSERSEAMLRDLIQVTRATAARVGKVGRTPFEWDDGQSGRALVPQLKLHPVGAEFIGLQFTVQGGSRQPRVVFGWVPTQDPGGTRELPNQVWRLSLSFTVGTLAWNVNRDEIMGVSSVELAEQIVMHLIEYRDEYLLAGRPTRIV
jgi:DNA-binding XRE family transcriptional regulator